MHFYGGEATFQNKEEYYYEFLASTSWVAFLIILIEMSIYLTYYKDVIFSMVTLVEFAGMLHVNRLQL